MSNTIDHNDITQVSRVFENAFGDFGDDWLVGILFAHASEEVKKSAVARAMEHLANRKEV
jgi:hypothetical protein